MKVRESLQALLAESGELTRTAERGDLFYRADVSRLKGGYAKIVSGINKTIDILVGHINELPSPVMIMDRELSIRYINRIADEAASALNEIVGGIERVTGIVSEIASASAVSKLTIGREHDKY